MPFLDSAIKSGPASFLARQQPASFVSFHCVNVLVLVLWNLVEPRKFQSLSSLGFGPPWIASDITLDLLP